jgi:hypothetical protein
MHVLPRRISGLIAALLAGLALVSMAGQADAATKTVRVANFAAPGKSLSTFAGNQVNMSTARSTANQKWTKTDVAFVPGFGTFSSYSNAGRCLEMASAFSSLVITQPCNPSRSGQQWTRGFLGDGRIENRLTLRSLTVVPGGIGAFPVKGDFFAGQLAQKWLELAP